MPGDPGTTPTPTPGVAVGEGQVDHRRLGVDLFNGTWDLMTAPARTSLEDDRMLHMAHASRYHWGQVGAPENLARGEWLCSRVYVVLGRPEPALHHATRVLELCRANGLQDWDLAFAHEALARALVLAGRPDEAARHVGEARAVPIADEEDRDQLSRELQTIEP